jgi:hypothetical protein
MQQVKVVSPRLYSRKHWQIITEHAPRPDAVESDAPPLCVALGEVVGLQLSVKGRVEGLWNLLSKQGEEAFLNRCEPHPSSHESKQDAAELCFHLSRLTISSSAASASESAATRG